MRWYTVKIMTVDVKKLEPGDVLLYSRRRSLVGLIISTKTWSIFTHVEVYVGQGKVVASRNGIGVGCYSFDPDGLAAVRRPIAPFYESEAMDWFEKVNGQGYDWLGLLSFFAAKHSDHAGTRQFCSEFATRFLRHGGVEPFQLDTDADAVPPSYFAVSPAFRPIS